MEQWQSAQRIHNESSSANLWTGDPAECRNLP